VDLHSTSLRGAGERQGPVVFFAANGRGTKGRLPGGGASRNLLMSTHLPRWSPRSIAKAERSFAAGRTVGG